EADQHRQRQRNANDERRTDVGEDEQNCDRGDDHLLAKRSGDGMDRRFNQPRAVVERDNTHALGQTGLKLADFVLDALGDLQRVSPYRMRTTPPVASRPSFSSALRRNAGPSVTLATSFNRIGTPLRLVITTFSRSASPASEPTPRMRYSVLPCVRTFPPTL